MTLTMPTPPTAASTSTRAALIDSAALANAVEKPKLWPMCGMSLSIVLGTPTMPICRPRRSISTDDVVRAAHRSVAADDHQDVDAELDEPVDDHGRVLRAARRAEDRAAALVDACDRLGGQRYDVVAELRDQPGVAVLEADHVAHAVVRVELEDDRADDVVEAGAEAAAGHDADLGRGWVEEDLVARAARLERRQLVERDSARGDQRERVVVQDPVVLADVVLVGLATLDVHREG